MSLLTLDEVMGTFTGHAIGPTRHYDVIDFVFVAKRRDQRKINDVIMTSRSYHVTVQSFPLGHCL